MKRNLSDYFSTAGTAGDAGETENVLHAAVSVFINCSTEQEYVETVFAFIFFGSYGSFDFLTDEYWKSEKYIC